MHIAPSFSNYQNELLGRLFFWTSVCDSTRCANHGIRTAALLAPLESLRENRDGSHANSISFIINGRQVGGIEAAHTHNRLSYRVPLPPCFNSKSIKTTKKAIGISFGNSLPLVSLSQATKAPRNTKRKKEKRKKEKKKKKRDNSFNPNSTQYRQDSRATKAMVIFVFRYAVDFVRFVMEAGVRGA